MKKVITSILIILALTSCNKKSQEATHTLELRISALENTAHELEVLKQEVVLLKQESELLKKNVMEQVSNSAHVASVVQQDQNYIFDALADHYRTLDILEIRVDLLEVNEDQKDHLEVLIPLEDERRHLTMLRSSAGTRIMIRLINHKFVEEEGGIVATVTMMNPESGNQKGLKFLTRAYTHDLVALISEDKDNKPYASVFADIDLPPGGQTTMDLFIPWEVADSPVVAIQLKDLVLTSYESVD